MEHVRSFNMVFLLATHLNYTYQCQSDRNFNDAQNNIGLAAKLQYLLLEYNSMLNYGVCSMQSYHSTCHWGLTMMFP